MVYMKTLPVSPTEMRYSPLATCRTDPRRPTRGDSASIGYGRQAPVDGVMVTSREAGDPKSFRHRHIGEPAGWIHGHRLGIPPALTVSLWTPGPVVG